MNDARKIFAALVFVLILTSTRAQYGQFEISITISDEAEGKIINDSLLSSIEKGTSITFDTLNFYVPMDIPGRMNRIRDLDLHKKKLSGLKVAIMWDTQKNQAVIMGYAPIYLTSTKYPFYISGSFNKILNKKHETLIRQNIKQSLFQSVNTFTTGHTDSTSFRKIPVDQFGCIYHLQFNYLPKLLFLMFSTHQLIFYDGPDLWNWTERREDSSSQFENARAIALCELWSDTLVFHSNPQPNPLYYDMYYLKKKIKSIGLELANGKTVWTSYEKFKGILVNSKNETMPGKALAYELFFQSDFCRQQKMDMYIK